MLAAQLTSALAASDDVPARDRAAHGRRGPGRARRPRCRASSWSSSSRGRSTATWSRSIAIGPDWAAVRRGPAALDARVVPARRPRARPPAAARTGAVTAHGGRARDPGRRRPRTGPRSWRCSAPRSDGAPTSASPTSSRGSTTGTRSGRRRRWSRSTATGSSGSARSCAGSSWTPTGAVPARGAGGRHRDRPRLPGSGDLPRADASARSTSSRPTASPSCSTRRTPRAGPATSAWDGSRSAGCRRRCGSAPPASALADALRRGCRPSGGRQASSAGRPAAEVLAQPGRRRAAGRAPAPARACGRTGRRRTCAGGTSSRRSATGR